jgi:hypothetical protein
MQNLKWKLSLGATIICLLYALFAGNNYRKENKDLKNQIENDFKSRITNLEQQLKTSEQQRLAANDTINNLSLHNKVLHNSVDSINQEIAKIKGRYKNLSSSDKAKELTRRANGE